MRAYFFGNYYLSQIQQGIQAQHCTADMFVKYHSKKLGPSVQETILYDWAENHKTSILLNGGNSANLRRILNLFCHKQNVYPFASFREDEQSLDGALTCVGIVLPHFIYEGASMLRKGEMTSEQLMASNHIVLQDENGETQVYGLSNFDILLMEELNNYRLA